MRQWQQPLCARTLQAQGGVEPRLCLFELVLRRGQRGLGLSEFAAEEEILRRLGPALVLEAHALRGVAAAE